MSKDRKKTKAEPLGWPYQPRLGRKKVLFINPPSVPYNALVRSFSEGFARMRQTIAMPMGILYLSSTLERDLPETSIQIVDISKRYREACDGESLQGSFESFTSKVLTDEVCERPDFIGLSILFSTAHKSTLKIAEECKRLWPDVPIVVGGMHATNAVTALLESPAIDFVCRGEGEAIISDLVLDPTQDLPGIIRKSSPESKASAPLIYDLDTIPHPAWHLLPMNEYVFGAVTRARSIDKIEQDGEATIVTTRGCPFHCTFCASWTVHGREMRYRSTDNVLEELRSLHTRYSVHTLIPEDDLFSVKKPRFLELCGAISKEFGQKLHFQFPNGLSVATLDADVISAMTKMGMGVANIAIESGSNEVQRTVIKKNVNLDRARSVVAECCRQGIATRAYFILGFPGETRAQMQETIEFAASLPADWCVFNVAAPLIGTEMYEQLLNRSEIDQSFNWDNAFFHERTYDTPEIGADELKDLAYRANLRINFFENYNLRIGRYDKAISLYDDILRSYPDHLAAQYCKAECLRLSGQVSKADDAMEAAWSMIESNAPLAVEQLGKFPELFLLCDEMKATPMVKNGLRLGVPSEARSYI